MNWTGLIPNIVASSNPSLSNPFEVAFKLDILNVDEATASTLAVKVIPKLLLLSFTEKLPDLSKNY